MNRATFVSLALTLLMGWASPASAASLKLTFHEGRVSLDAQDVTLREILTEWARVGRTRIVNLERINSVPMTLKFDAVAEDEALDIILRTLPGYMAAPRAVAMADASTYDRLLIMATTTAVAALAPRGQGATAQDPRFSVTELRRPQPTLNPGLLPDPSDDPRIMGDPSIAAAAAAGLISIPALQPGGMGTPLGAYQPPDRSGGPPPNQEPPPTAGSPSNPWNAPVGTSRPGLATPQAAPPPPPQNRPAGSARPQQADQ
jgi:hypothetical protein